MECKNLDQTPRAPETNSEEDNERSDSFMLSPSVEIDFQNHLRLELFAACRVNRDFLVKRLRGYCLLSLHRDRNEQFFRLFGLTFLFLAFLQLMGHRLYLAGLQQFLEDVARGQELEAILHQFGPFLGCEGLKQFLGDDWVQR